MKKPKALPLSWPDRESWTAEFRFHQRLWRFDWAHIPLKIAVEQEGGLFVFGGHSRGKAHMRDQEKFNIATAMGWRVFRFPPEDMESGFAANFIRDLLEGRMPEPKPTKKQRIKLLKSQVLQGGEGRG